MNHLDAALSRLTATVAEAKASARHSRETALLVARRKSLTRLSLAGEWRSVAGGGQGQILRCQGGRL